MGPQGEEGVVVRVSGQMPRSLVLPISSAAVLETECTEY